MTDELRDRVEAKKHRLLARYNELKADAKSESREQSSKVKAKLDELEGHLKAGWERLDAKVRAQLDKWVDHD